MIIVQPVKHIVFAIAITSCSYFYSLGQVALNYFVRGHMQVQAPPLHLGIRGFSGFLSQDWAIVCFLPNPGHLGDFHTETTNMHETFS